MKALNRRESKAGKRAFSRIDLLVGLAVLLMLAIVKFSAVAGSKQPGQSAICQNSLRQLGVAVLMYSAENNRLLPPRSKYPLWPERLHRYYQNTNFLVCPSDSWRGRDTSGPPGYPHSYVLNAWNDYFRTKLDPASWVVYMDQVNSIWGMPEAAIALPSTTITLGEKVAGRAHHYLDIAQITSEGGGGNDFEVVEQTQHFRSAFDTSKGGSNYAFADGSARFLRFGEALTPTNLWAVMPDWRDTVIWLPTP